MAYVASSCRLYTFGLGGNGQLGIGAKSSSRAPVLVASISNVVGSADHSVSLVSVYAGGDQCIALAAKVCRCSQIVAFPVFLPRAGSGVVRIDPLRYLIGCRTRRLNQALSVLSLSLGLF